jgi:hypothetical protein
VPGANGDTLTGGIVPVVTVRTPTPTPTPKISPSDIRGAYELFGIDPIVLGIRNGEFSVEDAIEAGVPANVLFAAILKGAMPAPAPLSP